MIEDYKTISLGPIVISADGLRKMADEIEKKCKTDKDVILEGRMFCWLEDDGGEYKTFLVNLEDITQG